MQTPQELLDRAAALLSDRSPIYEQMRQAERERGFRVVIPGETPWLSVDDWHESSVVSMDGSEVRLVAILAKRPGSFKRLLATLASHGLKPVVICPVGPIMPAIMRHYCWEKRDLGSGWDAEEQWRPPTTHRRRTYSRADLGREDYQPRFAIWLRVTPGGTAFDYMQWINRHSPRYLAERGVERVRDHDDFDAWLEVNAKEHAPLTEEEIQGLRGVLADALANGTAQAAPEQVSTENGK